MFSCDYFLKYILVLKVDSHAFVFNPNCKFFSCLFQKEKINFIIGVIGSRSVSGCQHSREVWTVKKEGRSCGKGRRVGRGRGRKWSDASRARIQYHTRRHCADLMFLQLPCRLETLASGQSLPSPVSGPTPVEVQYL